MRSGTLILAALLLAPTLALADESTTPRGGDPTRIDFTLPYSAALEKARATKRLIFLKPIYGGVDAAGARDYRCGSW